jgi:hypothetical protein
MDFTKVRVFARPAVMIVAGVQIISNAIYAIQDSSSKVENVKRDVTSIVSSITEFAKSVMTQNASTVIP